LKGAFFILCIPNSKIFFLNFASSKLRQIMKSIPNNFHKTVRFRRWSRANYAVFRSLTCVVTIGVLAAGICEKALLKNAPSNVSKNDTTSINSLVQCKEEKFRAEEILENIQLNTPVIFSAEDGKCCLSCTYIRCCRLKGIHFFQSIFLLVGHTKQLGKIIFINKMNQSIIIT
jgi:hypothetical protein